MCCTDPTMSYKYSCLWQYTKLVYAQGFIQDLVKEGGKVMTAELEGAEDYSSTLYSGKFSRGPIFMAFMVTV